MMIKDNLFSENFVIYRDFVSNNSNSNYFNLVHCCYCMLMLNLIRHWFFHFHP